MYDIDWRGTYAEIATATGWTWDYIRNNMTFARYAALKEYWKIVPPTNVMLLRIAQMIGYEQPKESGSSASSKSQSNDVFYDESYYADTPNTPHKANAFDSLASDFAAAGGVVT